MKVFTIYTKGSEQEEIVALNDEVFNKWAFVFGPLWAAYNKMWFIGLGLFLLMSIFVSISMHFFGSASYVSNLFLLIYAFFAYDLMDYKLRSAGYAVKEVIIAENAAMAELEYLRKIKV
jgi:hypothetical protein